MQNSQLKAETIGTESEYSIMLDIVFLKQRNSVYKSKGLVLIDNMVLNVLYNRV